MLIVTAIVCTAALILVEAEHPTTCPPGYKQYDYHCFLLLSEALTFFEAHVACDLVDGKLVEMTSPEDLTRVERYLSTVQLGLNSNVWIGATDLQQEGTWRYLTSDNQNALSSWSHWAPSYPRRDKSSNCAAMNIANSWRWTDNQCSYHQSALCEVRLRIDKLVG